MMWKNHLSPSLQEDVKCMCCMTVDRVHLENWEEGMKCMCHVTVDRESGENWEESVKEGLLEKCQDIKSLVHIYVDKNSREVSDLFLHSAEAKSARAVISYSQGFRAL